VNILQFLSNNPALIWALVVIGAPLITRIWRKLNEQKRKRDEAIRREREEMERLRTGRGLTGVGASDALPQAAAPPTSARATLEDMAARRRAQIEQLRQKKMGQVAPPPTAPAPVRQQSRPAKRPQMAPSGLTPPPQQMPQQRSRQAPARRQAQPPVRTSQPQRQQQRSVPVPTIAVEPPEREETHAAAAMREDLARQVATPSAAPTVSPVRRGWAFTAKPKTIQDWRRAIIVQELLSTPPALRP
jgi:hypothetical protein